MVFGLPPSVKIYFARDLVDMRNGIDGLRAIVETALTKDHRPWLPEQHDRRPGRGGRRRGALQAVAHAERQGPLHEGRLHHRRQRRDDHLSSGRGGEVRGRRGRGVRSRRVRPLPPEDPVHALRVRTRTIGAPRRGRETPTASAGATRDAGRADAAAPPNGHRAPPRTHRHPQGPPRQVPRHAQEHLRASPHRSGPEPRSRSPRYRGVVTLDSTCSVF